jgi:DNA-binding HxlR family transcriptional regulator
VRVDTEHFELKRLVEGVGDKVLIQQLKGLEVVMPVQTDYKEVSPRADSALTSLVCSPGQ